MQARSLYSTEAYLAMEAEAETKHEYWYGQIFAMAGASPVHNQIVFNLARAMGDVLLKKGCRSATSDQRVQLKQGQYVYPDVVVICDEPRYTDDNPAAVCNPTLLVEVISPSTSAHDRHAKMRAYTQLESLQEYWMVDQDEASIVRAVRSGDGWTLHFTTGLDATLRTDTLGLDLAMADVYALVDLPEPPRLGVAD